MRLATNRLGREAQPLITARVGLSSHKLRVEVSVVLSAASLSPAMALLFGVLILILPRMLNYLVAIYLILSGLIGLGILAVR